MSSPTNKKFLLGVGAQKGGTTWLHHYLYNHPSANLGFTKEYHIFDALWIHESVIQSKWLQNRINRVLAPDAKPTRADVEILKFLGNPELYFDYFKTLTDKEDGVCLTGDITPSYSGLPADAFAYIKNSLDKLNFKIKVIFLMRDPIERCISAMRMELKNAMRGRPWDSAKESEQLREKFKLPGYQLRTRYDTTITNLEQIFSPEQIFYGFYEELFTEGRIKEVCAFLEIPFVHPDFDVKLNVSRTKNRIDDSLLMEVREFYDPVYQYVGKKFGVEKMASIWKNFSMRSSI